MRLRAMAVKYEYTGESVQAVPENRGEIEHHRTHDQWQRWMGECTLDKM